MKKSEAFAVFFVITIIALYFIATGLRPVFAMHKGVLSLDEFLDGNQREGRYIEDTIHVSSQEIMAYEHTMNYLIPLGTEHFFLIFNEDGSKCMVLRADEKWAEEFDARTGYSQTGVMVSGLVKSLDYEVRYDLQERVAELKREGISLEVSFYCVDGLTKTYAMLNVLAGVLAIVLEIGFTIVIKKQQTKTIPVYVLSAVLFLELGLMLHLLTMN